MPPRRFSRHSFVSLVLDDETELLSLTDREPFRFQDFTDNEAHRVREGDTLFTLAGNRYKQFERPAGLWWVIGDFQPDPIHDPTINLAPGRTLFIPSVRTLIEEIFSASREAETTP